MSFVRSGVLVLILLGSALLRAQSPVPTASTVIPSQNLVAGGAPVTLDLRNYFNLPGVTGQVVQFNTVRGRFNFELFADTPISTANFLSYVNSGTYNNTIIHRSVPGFVIQGGGYTYSVTPSHIPVSAAIRNEYARPNVRGTVAMAKVGGDPNSATSEWFVNLADNRSNLDNQNGGFTVFARVLGNGMAVVDNIAALQTATITFTSALTLADVPVQNITTGQSQVQLQNLIGVSTVATIPIYPAVSGDTAVLSFTAASSTPGVVTASVAGSVLTLTPGTNSPGAVNVAVNVTATETNGATASQTFVVTMGGSSSGQAPNITVQPSPQIRLPAGASTTVALNVAATGTPAPTYQWRRNGATLTGQTSPSCILTNVTADQAGSYTCLVTNSVASVESQPAVVSFAATGAADLGRLINLAIRTSAGSGPQTLIVGFALGGAGTSGSTPLLVRAMGPSLGQFGLTGILADPVAILYQGNTNLATNDNWSSDATAISARAAQVGAFNFASTSSLDAALALTPGAASYTVLVSEKNNRTGIALAEIYDASTRATFTATTPRLVNVSARTEVGAGNDILIAGFVVGGTTAKTVLIRAIGPTLANFGVTDTLADPRLQLFAGATLLAENDNWGGNTNLIAVGDAVGAFRLSNSNSGDAVFLATLPPGSYTAQVSGANGGTGVALVEIYEVP